MTLEELAAHYPRLFHMAESGTWESIRRNGLLSTTALLDAYGIVGMERRAIEEMHRPQCVTVSNSSHGTAVIRDQKPMSDAALDRCLQQPWTPAKWYKLLNGHVFFWASEHRLSRLLKARAYSKKSHCVLTVDTQALLTNHGDAVLLCPINSGSTLFRPQNRGEGTFSPVSDYPFEHWRAVRSLRDAVVEVVVPYSVPNIAQYVIRVEERKGDTILKVIYPD